MTCALRGEALIKNEKFLNDDRIANCFITALMYDFYHRISATLYFVLPCTNSIQFELISINPLICMLTVKHHNSVCFVH